MGCSFIAPIQSLVGDVVDVVAPIAAAIPGPWQVPAMVVLAIDTVNDGGDLFDVVKRVGTAYVAGEIGSAVGAAADSAAAAAGYGSGLGSTQSAMLAAQEAGMGTLGDIAGNIAGGVARSTVMGNDPMTALVTGGIGAGVGELTSQIPGFSDMPAAAQNAIKATMTAELAGQDPSQAILNSALSAGMQEAGRQTAAAASNLPTSSSSGYPVQDFGEGNATQYMDEYQQNLQGLADEGGYTSQWVPDASGNHTLTNDDGSTITVDSMGDVIGTTNATDTPYVGAKSLNLSNLAAAIPATLAGSTAVRGATPTGGLPSYIDQAALPGGYKTVGTMGGDMPQQALKQLNLDETLNPEYAYITDEPVSMVDPAKAMRVASGLPAAETFYAQGGLVQHFAEGDQPTPAQLLANQYATADMNKALKNLGEVGTEVKLPTHNLRTVKEAGMAYSPKVLPRLAALLQSRGMNLAEGGQPSDTEHPNYDGVPVFRTGGLEGLGGKYVEGKGDGTSDDITAMLANGEYVFSADVVSALGNGSNKAGAEKLGEMVKAIRERARSAPPDKLPPDAKSPLEYLKSPKGKKNG